MSQSRQLAAIMFTDIVGYTALMGKDSAKALELVRISKEIQKPLVEKHHGQWLKEMGDGALAKFGTALDAVNCSLEIQEIARGKLDAKLRIGLHLGDITIENNDVYGDGVNVAARLESIADPGGIYLSESIEKAIRGQSDVQAKYLGESRLKNIDYGVRTYAVQGVGLPVPAVKGEKELSGHFWAELHRREVIRAGFTYLLIALVLILLHRESGSWMELPAWTFTALVTALGLGLPIALYLAWNYERSPQGFVRTTSQQSWRNPYPASQRKPLTGGVIVGILLVISLGIYLLSFNEASPEEIEKEENEVDLAESIAIVPFANLSNDPEQDYFSIGIMEAILNHLVKIPNLGVISRTTMMQYKNSELSIPEIARAIGARYILEGSVQKASTNVRISIQLIDGQSDLHLWSDNYDRSLDDIFEIQSEVALKVAENLRLNMKPSTRTRIESRSTRNGEAYDIFMRALYQFENLNYGSTEALAREIELLEKAIALDSTFAPAYAMLGNDWLFQAGVVGRANPQDVSEKGRNYLLKALLLDPLNGLANALMGDYYLWMEWDFDQAEARKLTALELEPSNNAIKLSYTDLLMATGRSVEALSILQSVVDIERINTNWSYLALAQAFTGSELEVIQEATAKALRDTPFTGPYTESARAHLIVGDYSKVIAILEDFPGTSDIPRAMGTLAIAKYKTGDETEYTRLVNSLIEWSQETAGGSPSFYLAMVHASMNETEKAFKWLDKAYQDREIEMYWLMVEPEFKTLYDDPRWQEMLDKVGFPK